MCTWILLQNCVETPYLGACSHCKLTIFACSLIDDVYWKCYEVTLIYVKALWLSVEEFVGSIILTAKGVIQLGISVASWELSLPFGVLFSS